MFKKSTRTLAALGLVFATVACNATISDVSKTTRSRAPLKVTLSASERVLANKTNGETAFSAYLTGYSYWDNTPRGSTAISNPVIHRGAGGKGTYKDPITIAVGHRYAGSRDILDFPEGTKFYIKRLKKYAIVEDTCGDGNRPQTAPCHIGYKGNPWVDIYVGGRKSTDRASTSCANKLTAVQPIIMNPRPDYPVEVGELVATGCKVFRG